MQAQSEVKGRPRGQNLGEAGRPDPAGGVTLGGGRWMGRAKCSATAGTLAGRRGRGPPTQARPALPPPTLACSHVAQTALHRDQQGPPPRAGPPGLPGPGRGQSGAGPDPSRARLPEELCAGRPTALGDKEGAGLMGGGGSPLLPAPAQQDADTLVQGGPAGLVCEQGQQVGPERWHLGARVAFALVWRKFGWPPPGCPALVSGAGGQSRQPVGGSTGQREAVTSGQGLSQASGSLRRLNVG